MNHYCDQAVAHPAKTKHFVQHLYNVGPTSSTLVQHCTNVIQMICLYWVYGNLTIGLSMSCVFTMCFFGHRGTLANFGETIIVRAKGHSQMV